MSQPTTIEGRAFSSYIESATRPNSSAREVVVGNTPDNPIPLIEVGTPNSIYNEVNAVGTESLEIFNLIVPLTVGYVLKTINFSGDNVATYTLIINNEIKFKIRSNYTNFNPDLVIGNLQIRENDNLKVLVTSLTNEPASFNATLKYNEFDL